MDKKIKEIITDGVKGADLEAHVEIPVYEKYRGKSFHGEKTWKATDKEKKTMKLLAAFFIAMCLLPIVSLFIVDSMLVEMILFFTCIIAAIGVVGGYMFYIAHKHNKEDPMDAKYYDVDYEANYITGDINDKTREISKDEFFGKVKNEEDTEVKPESAEGANNESDSSGR